MLGAIEPIFEIRFIEQIGTQKVSTTIDKFPATVGHKGTVRPVILNGQISSFHCKIDWNFFRQEYQVEDGVDGKPSTNHIYSSENGGELVLCDRAVLRTPSDRVYLMRTNDGKEGYLELFDPNKQPGGNPRSTLSLDPELIELKALASKADERAIEGLGVAIETKAIVQKNSEAIGELEVLLDSRVRQVLSVLQIFGSHPRVFLVGASVFLVTGIVGLTLLFVHANMNNIYNDIRSRNQHNERVKDPDLMTPKSD